MARKQTHPHKAVCLFSGGLDSATLLYYAIQNGYHPHALTIDYGQIHKKELDSARRIVGKLNLKHQVVSIELPWGGSALLDSSIPIPHHRRMNQIARHIPKTYVPARNTIFLSLAASYAEAIGADTILIGANAVDYSGYPDCRPDYFKKLNAAVKCGTKRGREGKPIKIQAPFVKWSKSDIIRLGSKLKVPYELTWSCYRGKRVPCLECDSCLLRAKGFQEAGRKDPLLK